MKISDKALELIIQDVIGAMEELTLEQSSYCNQMAYTVTTTEQSEAPAMSATIIPFPDMKNRS